MNPDNYGSLPACKRLAEMLAKKEISVTTEVYWHIPENGEPELLSVCFLGSLQCFEGCKIIPAYSMPEVWRELRKHIPDYQMHGRIWNALREELFTDALIELWIWALGQEGK